jgi:hypothetical protein
MRTDPGSAKGIELRRRVAPSPGLARKPRGREVTRTESPARIGEADAITSWRNGI